MFIAQVAAHRCYKCARRASRSMRRAQHDANCLPRIAHYTFWSLAMHHGVRLTARSDGRRHRPWIVYSNHLYFVPHLTSRDYLRANHAQLSSSGILTATFYTSCLAGRISQADSSFAVAFQLLTTTTTTAATVTSTLTLTIALALTTAFERPHPLPGLSFSLPALRFFVTAPLRTSYTAVSSPRSHPHPNLHSRLQRLFLSSCALPPHALAPAVLRSRVCFNHTCKVPILILLVFQTTSNSFQTVSQSMGAVRRAHRMQALYCAGVRWLRLPFYDRPFSVVMLRQLSLLRSPSL